VLVICTLRPISVIVAAAKLGNVFLDNVTVGEGVFVLVGVGVLGVAVIVNVGVFEGVLVGV